MAVGELLRGADIQNERFLFGNQLRGFVGRDILDSGSGRLSKEGGGESGQKDGKEAEDESASVGVHGGMVGGKQQGGGGESENGGFLEGDVPRLQF